jgi:hypothetical protein
LLDRLGLRHQPDLAAGPIGLVLMCGAIATLLAQWGLIPLARTGAAPSTMAGMALAAVGACRGAGPRPPFHCHRLRGLFARLRPVPARLYRRGEPAVGPAEQGQAAGIVAAVNGSAYIVSPAIGVWLYNHSSWMVWTVIEMLALGILALFLAERRSVQA